MGGVSVALIDQFAPEVIAAFQRALPAAWQLRVSLSREEADIAAALAEADIAFVMAASLPARVLQHAPHLKFVQKLGAGVDKIDLDHCEARGIAVARLYAGNAIPVAEHTVMLMLAACRRLPLLDRNTRAGQWQKEESRGVNRHLSGKTVGIVGFGAIGRAVARVLSGFGVRILYYDPVPASAAVEMELNAGRADLDTLLAESDVVSLHLPLTKSSARFLDAARLASMKRGAILINCARGDLVDEPALVDALRTGQLSAAGLDTFAVEPPIASPLLELDNVVITPHCAGATIDNVASVARRAVENASLFLAGEALPAEDLILPRMRVAG